MDYTLVHYVAEEWERHAYEHLRGRLKALGWPVDDVEFDESSQAYQSQVSVAVVDPKTNKVIGAVTVGVNVEG